MGGRAEMRAGPDRAAWRGEVGSSGAVCGSCSAMSRQQIAVHAANLPAREAAADDIVAGIALPAAYADWIMQNQHADGPPLVYSSAEPDAVRAAQQRHGRERVAEAVEGFFARLAQELARRGVKRLVSAGGETSGAVVSALAIRAFEIGPEIDPGVPALRAPDLGMTLALKSGNFGSPDFFVKAAAILGDPERGK